LAKRPDRTRQVSVTRAALSPLATRQAKQEGDRGTPRATRRRATAPATPSQPATTTRSSASAGAPHRLGNSAGTGPTATARAAGTDMATPKKDEAKEARTIRELRARQRKRVAAIRKLNARYVGRTFPKREAAKWDRLNRDLDETEELITELRARNQRSTESDDREE
jgi:hypothetical protein